MSWNNNGNNGSRDPWGGKDGPPDIDEALKKFRDQFSFLFGKRSSSGGGDFKPRKILTSTLAVISILYAALGIYTVDAQEQAVVLRFGEYVNTKGPGIHWNPPIIDTRTIVNTEKLFTHTATSSMLTKDENIVIVEIGVQYKKSNPVNYLLEASTPDDSLAQASEAALRHVVGSNIMDDVLTTGREQIAFDVKDRLQQRLDDYLTGIEVVTVNVKESKPPDAVREAFDDVVKAREDEVRLRNQAETYANEVVPIARGDAQRTIQDAEGYKNKVIAEAEGDASRFSQLLVEYKKAPEVTRQRLYLDAVQSVMDSSTKVMIDVQDGNNILYLPLDKIASAAVAADRNNSSSNDDQDISIGDITDQVIEEIRKRQERR